MNFIKEVPGFRSNNKKNKIIASTYYFILLSNMLIVSAGDNPGLVVLSMPAIILPFVFFAIVDIKKNIQNKNVIKKVVLPITLMILFTFVAYYQH